MALPGLEERIPHDIEAEVALLATLAAGWRQEQTYLILPDVEPDLFFVPQHRLVFAAIRNIVNKNQELNLISIKAEIDRAGMLNQVGDTNGLVEILSSTEVSNPTQLVERLRDLRTRRQLLDIGYQLTQLSVSNENSSDLASEARDRLNRILSGTQTHESTTALRALDYASESKPFYLAGRRYCMGMTGIPEFDQSIVIPAAEPVYLGARPGCGKTALAIQIAVESVRTLGATPLIVSLELTEPKLMARLAAYLTRVPADTWRRGEYTKEDVDILRRKVDVLSQIHQIYPDQGTPWGRIESRIRRVIDKHKCDLILIDYFGFIGRPAAKGNTEAYSFAAVSESITAFCKQTTTGCVILHQLKSDTDAARGRKPNLSDLSDSDRPARDAAIVMMLWRDLEGATWCTVPKNRDGVAGLDFRLSFDGQTGRFNWAPREARSEASTVGTLWK